MGWRGSASHWRHYKVAYGLLGGLATPLVLSVHSIVSLDFTIAQLPGWHSTIFPPYFVAGAIYSGFALVLTLMIPCREIFGLKKVITNAHYDSMAKMLLVTGWIVTYTYILEAFLAWFSGDKYEIYAMFKARYFGDWTFVAWGMMIFCNCVVLQLLWIPSLRKNPLVLWGISVLINVGMWSERFVIIVTSLYHDFLPSSWHHYSPTWVDFSLLFGSMCFFMFNFLLFIKFVPFIPIWETRELKHEIEHEPAKPAEVAA